jgi:predicted ArsR family transcriptional regulator
MSPRERLLAELRAAPSGLDARELSRRLGVHPNTVRWHVGALADSISSEPVGSGGRGRPRIVYRLRPEAIASTPDEYRLLANVLSGTLAETRDGAAAAERAGRAWGAYLVERPPPHAPLSPEAATERVLALLGRQGFAPELAAGGIRMCRCPFHELAEARPEIVCAVHKGLIAGALDGLGSNLEVERLDVFVEPDRCVVSLR